MHGVADRLAAVALAEQLAVVGPGVADQTAHDVVADRFVVEQLVVAEQHYCLACAAVLHLAYFRGDRDTVTFADHYSFAADLPGFAVPAV